MIARWLALTALAALLAGQASAQDSYRHGRVLHVEGNVTIQQASEWAAEEAVPNLPFLPGDRVWTDRDGRGEFQFADGSLIRIDSRSKLEYALEQRHGRDRVVLRLWSGNLIVRPRDGQERLDMSVEVPGGLYVDLLDAGLYRVGLERGETRIAVYEGGVMVEGDHRVRVRAGQQIWARGARIEARAEPLDRGDLDDFASWDEDRQANQARARSRVEYLPDEVAVYAPELEEHGAWYYEVEVGHVWRPYVSASWQPYSNGRWAWTPYGWTWVPNDSWGWAVSHYGRWGRSARLGWYWIPSGGWGPAWVSWAAGDDYVAWCPLGRGDRVTAGQERGRERAKLRGSFSDVAWTVARRGDLTKGDLAKRRIEAGPALTRELRPLEGARRLARDLTVTDRPVATPRIRTRPTPGDTVPELRGDPATTIPAPTARTRYESEREQREQERSQTLRRSRPKDPLWDSTSGAREMEPGRSGGLDPSLGIEDPARSRDEKQQSKPAQDRYRSEEKDRDRDRVLGPVFRSLSRPRGKGDEGARGDDLGRAKPEEPSVRKPAPGRAEPHTPPRQKPGAESSSKPSRDKGREK